MKKIFLFIILLFFPHICVHANEVSSIEMNIHIDSNGNANVIETWNASVDSGTEGYHPYYNLGSAKITNLTVSMDGREFETVSWDVKKSMSDKAYKAGIYYTGDGEYDLCFGISSYGIHTYVMKYTIEGFVVKLADADMVYWNLFPKDFSVSPNNVSIKIHSDFKYDDTLDVWGYGKYGAPCYVANGVIEMTSDNSQIKSDEYMTILIKFPKDTFNSYHKLDKDFNYYRKLAEEGAINYNKKSFLASLFEFIKIAILIFLFVFLPFYFLRNLLAFCIDYLFNWWSNGYRKYDFGKMGRKIKEDVPYFREIPYNSIYRAYWICYVYKINKRKENLFGAFILKWLFNGNVEIIKEKRKKLFRKESYETIIKFNHIPEDADEHERELYSFMCYASENFRLEKKEFKKWCRKNYLKILSWYNSVLKKQAHLFSEEGKISISYLDNFTSERYKINDSMIEEVKKMIGLKNFLKDFSKISDRKPIEVKLWNEYLIYAQIFGIADQVANQFKEIYPGMIESMKEYGMDFENMEIVNNIDYDVVRSVSFASFFAYSYNKNNDVSFAKDAAQSYSGGGGGFSSGGGGGGSFGGGGGGGGFR